MATTKYVRHSALGFVLFPDSPDLWHRHVGRWLQASLRGELVSAGFVLFSAGTVRCHGRSESLDLGCQPDDSAALAQQLGLRVADPLQPEVPREVPLEVPFASLPLSADVRARP